MRNILCAGIIIVLAVLGSISISCGGGGTTPVTPTPAWTSPVHHFTGERFPTDYIVDKEYQLRLMRSVGDAVNATPDQLVVGLYTASGVLFPYGASLHMISVGDLFVNEMGKFMATTKGQKILKVQIWDNQGHLYATVEFKLYFRDGLLWDSPVGRFHIEAQPASYVVGQFYDVELVKNMGDLIAREPNQIMVGLYRKGDQGALFSEIIGLKFVPSGASLFINEFGEFMADSAGQKTIIAEVVDSQGHLYVTVVFHPWFVNPGGNPPPPPPPSDKNLYAVDGNLEGFYSGSGQQSLTLELKPVPAGVGFINWELLSGPSGAMTVPIGVPARQCEFYYTASGGYAIRAVPYESESAFDTGKPPVGQPAVFTVMISLE